VNPVPSTLMLTPLSGRASATSKTRPTTVAPAPRCALAAHAGTTAIMIAWRTNRSGSMADSQIVLPRGPSVKRGLLMLTSRSGQYVGLPSSTEYRQFHVREASMYTDHDHPSFVSRRDVLRAGIETPNGITWPLISWNDEFGEDPGAAGRCGDPDRAAPGSGWAADASPGFLVSSAALPRRSIAPSGARDSGGHECA